MQRFLYHFAAFMLAAIYACDGLVMHVAHDYYHAGHQHAASDACGQGASPCGHSHDSHAADDHAHSGADQAQPDDAAPQHDHENCEICRYLAVQWILVEAPAAVQQSELVVPVVQDVAIRCGSRFALALRCRAPPVV